MDFTQTVVKKLIDKGADKAEVTFLDKSEDEFSMKSGEFALLRTNYSKSLRLKIIKDKKQAKMTVNKLDDKSLDSSMDELFTLCSSSPADDSYDISDLKGEYNFSTGDNSVDKNKAAKFLSDFTADLKKQYPKISLRENGVTHVYAENITSTSNGLHVKESHGFLNGSSLFTAQEGDNVTSMNFSYGQMKNLETPFLNCFDTEAQLKNTVSLLDAEKLTEGFKGDIIATRGAFGFLAGSLFAHLGDASMISGSSYFKGKKGQKVVSDKFNLSVVSQSDELAKKDFLTSDKFLTKDYKIFENGVLNHYLLTQYGAKKTNLEPTNNDGQLFKVAPGDKSIDEMISGIKKGIIVGYLSAGQPSNKGDFSGVAKNSFLIEDGKITKPLKEVMIAGNVFDMFENISAISKEALNDGASIVPFIQFPNINIS